MMAEWSLVSGKAGVGGLGRDPVLPDPAAAGQPEAKGRPQRPTLQPQAAWTSPLQKPPIFQRFL